MLDLSFLGGHASVNITPILVALVWSLGPIIGAFVVRNAIALLMPLLKPYMDEKTLEAFQARFNHIANQGIAWAVQQGAARVEAGKPITVDVKNWMAGQAVEYVARNAPNTAAQAGDVLEKVLARFDLHPAVQALVSPAPPTEPVTQ